MRVLIVGQPNGWFVRRAKEEGEKRGVVVDGCWANSLVSRHDASGVAMTVNDEDLFSYDVIHFFTVQENRSAWYAAGGEAAKRGAVIVDRNCITTSIAEQSIVHKLPRQSELGLPFPATTLVMSFPHAMTTLRAAKWPIVIKTLNSRKGRGVARIRHWWDFLAFYLRNRRNSAFIFRELIDGVGDYRITVIDGKAYVAAHRKGQGSEWRNNMSLGGIGTNIPLEEVPELVRIAEDAAKAFAFDMAGVDIMVGKNGQPYILEINRSPELDSFEEMSGINLVGKVLDLYEHAVTKTTP